MTCLPWARNSGVLSRAAADVKDCVEILVCHELLDGQSSELNVRQTGRCGGGESGKLLDVFKRLAMFCSQRLAASSSACFMIFTRFANEALGGRRPGSLPARA